MPQDWYSVRSIVKIPASRDGERPELFEERVVMFRAGSPKEALDKGRAEAKKYAEEKMHGKLLSDVLAYCILEEDLPDGCEVWSCFRKLDLTDPEYLARFYEGEHLSGWHVEPGEEW